MTRIRFDGCDLSPRGARTPRYGQRTAAALGCVLLLVLVGGCGGGGDARLSKSDYEHEIDSAGQRLSAVFSLIDQNTPNLHQFAVKVDRARGTLDEVTGDLANVKPPEKAEPAHDQLVGSLRELSGELHSLAAAARSGNEKQTKLARSELSRPARAILQAIQALQQAGFDVNEGAD